MRQIDAQLAHHADQVSVTQLEVQVPPNAQDHNLRIEMAAGEQLFAWNEAGHSPIFAHAAEFAPEPLGQGPVPSRERQRG
jgi:hypothetical protein